MPSFWIRLRRVLGLRSPRRGTSPTPNKLLVPNPINRYLINSPMLPQLKKDKDGGLTLYLRADRPGKDKESNWLPAPKGPFFAVLRIYWPKPEALDGTWKQPPLVKVQ
jgi:hypothetical protein